jgi:hypothetical protein
VASLSRVSAPYQFIMNEIQRVASGFRLLSFSFRFSSLHTAHEQSIFPFFVRGPLMVEIWSSRHDDSLVPFLFLVGRRLMIHIGSQRAWDRVGGSIQNAMR